MSTINGTDGNDSVTVTGGTTAADTMYYNVDLGAGVDTLTLDYRSMVDGVSFTGMRLWGGQGYQASVKDPSMTKKLVLDANNFEHVTFLGGSASDDVLIEIGGLIATGAGDDTISYAGGAGSSIDGGAGYDHLTLSDMNLPGDFAQWNLEIHGVEAAVLVDIAFKHEFVIDQALFGADLHSLTLSGRGTVIVDGRFAQKNALSADIFLNGAEAVDTLVLDYRGLKASVGVRDGTAGIENTDGVVSYQGAEHLTILGGELRDDISFKDSSIPLTVVSAGGDDLIYTGRADDSITAGSGNDEITLVDGRDTVDGGSGNDTIVCDLPIADRIGDLIFGGPGNDTISAGLGDDALSGGMGNDVIDDLGGANSISGGAGDDAIFSGGEGDSIEGGSGSDFIECVGGSAQISGGYGDDLISVGYMNSTIDGGEGNDYLEGWGSQIYGGVGNDMIAGSGSVFGGIGNDEITILNDNIDAIEAGQFFPSDVYAGAGDDFVSVLSVNKDTIYGGIGNDVIDARAGFQDLIDGGFGNDQLLGSSSADTIFGSLGMDTIAGGAGADELMGGRGADWFVFDSAPAGDNVDTLADFISGVDHLVLDDTIFVDLGIIGVQSGTALPAELFHAGTAASDAQQRVIFDRDSGALYYDADGSGSGEAVQIALIAGNTALLNAGDFLII